MHANTRVTNPSFMLPQAYPGAALRANNRLAELHALSPFGATNWSSNVVVPTRETSPASGVGDSESFARLYVLVGDAEDRKIARFGVFHDPAQPFGWRG